MQPTIAITIGDLAGIGPEVIQKALADSALPHGFQFEIVGLEAAKSHLITPGKSTHISARIAWEALNDAAAGWRAGRFAAIVTGPVQKETIFQIAPNPPGFIGQTEFCAQACGLPDGDAIMVLTDPRLTVALVTAHCSLKQALGRITSQQIAKTARALHAFLVRIGITVPRIALAGLNPHAGENGLFGDEEQRIFLPALELIRGEGITMTGPYPPDTLFYQTVVNRRFDGVVCAYHDQGLIPFKLVAFETGVNVTLGLPLIRTSPDHGTALDLAGKGVADHRSMLAAIQLACRLTQA